MTVRAPGGTDDLSGRFRDHVAREGLLSDGDHVLVALSGGLDSVVLLHLLRFHPPVRKLRITAAHLDHRMREGSAADARWTAGLARAWQVPLVSGIAQPVPSSETEAREARYAFLRRVAAAGDIDRIATAHHADDQAETVLFRVVRGSGPTGLAGIRASGPDGLVRPLLPFWRDEIERWAVESGLRWREDPTNAHVTYARNVLRQEILPRLEADVASGAREALVRLARLAEHEDQAWKSLLPGLLSGIVDSADERRIVVSRPAFVAYHPAVRARLLREIVGRFGVVLDEAGTRVAEGFAASGASGRGVDLAGNITVRRDFDRIVFEVRSADEGATPMEGGLVIRDPGPGTGRLDLGGRCLDVRWSPGGPVEGPLTARFAMDTLVFPLRLRGWHPGDRIRLGYGEKKLKKLFAEARVPARERWTRPLLLDASGEVLWVPGLARSARTPRDEAGESLTLRIDDARED